MTPPISTATNRHPDALAVALLRLLTAWMLIAAVPRLLAAWLARPAALCLTFALVAALAIATRATRARPSRSSLAALALAAAAGFASLPAWVAGIAWTGRAAGLPAGSPAAPGGAAPLAWLSLGLLAPVFEELLYRERLLDALGRAFGGAPAVAISSSLFALPHLEPWPVLGSFAVGLLLGTAMWTTGSLALCIGLHAGLNAAALWCGVPPVRSSLPAPDGALLGALLLAAAAGLARPPGARRRPAARALARLALIGACLVAPRLAGAGELTWQGTLSLEFAAPGLGPLALAGTGVAAVNGSGGGGHLASLRLSGGITGTATAPVTDPLLPTTLAAVEASAALGSGDLAPFSPPAPASQPQLTLAAVPVHGELRLCLFDPECGNWLALPLTQSSARTGLGVGGLLTLNGFGKGTQISARAAPWTVRTATLSVVTSNGSSVTLAAQGWRHGAGSFTSSTALPGGALSLVTPLQITSDAGQELALFARWTARFVPEPGWGLLVGAGAAGLLLLTRPRGPA